MMQASAVMPCAANKKTQKTQEAIRLALLSLMGTKAVSAISVSELTQTADISRKTFYLHYRNVEDPLDELESELEQQVVSTLDNCDLHSERHNLYAILARINDEVQKRPEYTGYMRTRRSWSFMLHRMKNSIKAAVMRQVWRYTPKSDELDLAADFAVSGVISLYYEWLRTQKTTLRQAAETGQIMLSGAWNSFQTKMKETEKE